MGHGSSQTQIFEPPKFAGTFAKEYLGKNFIARHFRVAAQDQLHFAHRAHNADIGHECRGLSGQHDVQQGIGYSPAAKGHSAPRQLEIFAQNIKAAFYSAKLAGDQRFGRRATHVHVCLPLALEAKPFHDKAPRDDNAQVQQARTAARSGSSWGWADGCGGCCLFALRHGRRGRFMPCSGPGGRDLADGQSGDAGAHIKVIEQHKALIHGDGSAYLGRCGAASHGSLR